MAKSPTETPSGLQISAVGIPWYEQADYPAILALMSDAHLLPAIFNDWLQRAKHLESDLSGQGHRAIRAIVQPQAVAGWCAVRGYADIDAQARTAFANEQAARQIGL